MLDPASSIASIVALGDSLTEGTGASTVGNRWQQVLQGLLRARLQPAGVTGADVPYLSAWPRMSPMPSGYGRTATAGVTQASYGLGLRAASVPAGENVTFTFTGTRARLLGTKGPAVGKYGIRLDGGAETVVDGNAAAVVSGQIIWDSGTLTAGAHTVLVQRSPTTVVSPGAVLPEGLMTYNGDTTFGVRVVDSGRHGAIAASFWTSTAWHNAFAAIEGKQLLIMPWGANDSVSATTTAVFRSGVEQIIDAARGAGFAGMVMLPKMPKRGSADPDVWVEYLEALDSIAAGDPAVMTVDVRSRFPDQGTAEAVARGLYADEVHMSDAGQALLADILAEAIMPPEWPDAGDLTVHVAAAFGADLAADPDTWTWTDLSSRLANAPITIRVPDAQFSPGTCSVTLLNDDGALTPSNAASVHWPDVELGVPLRVRVLWDGVWRDRFSGFADQWEPTIIPITVDESSSVVRVTCSGVLRRLTQGTPPSRSAMRRAIPASGAIAYWPVEDGRAAGQVASAFSGHAPLSIIGPVPKFDDIESWTEGRGYEVRYGTAALADLSAGSILSATVPGSVTSATAAGWTVAIAADIPDGSLATDLALIEVETAGGTFPRWRLVITPAGHTQVVAYDASGTPTTVMDHSGRTISMSVHNVAVWQSGGNVQVGWEWNSVTGYRNTGLVAGTLGGVTRVSVNAAATTSPIPVPAGHIGVWAGHDLGAVDRHDGPMFLALYAYEWTNIDTGASAPTGEPATVRLARFVAEDGLSIDMPPVDPESEVMMGRQGVGTPMDLYRECVEADIGQLHESGFGLGYIPRQYRYNKPVDMVVDLASYCVTGGSQHDVLKSTYDDQDIRNRLTVTRVDGSSVVVDDTASQHRNGVYADSVELNLASDSKLADYASWLAHLGTVGGLREKTFPLDLAANPDLVGGWLSCGVGSRIVRTNPPSQYGGEPLDRLVEGWTETIGTRSWLVQVNPSPATPWDVATADGDQRAAADGSTLAGTLTGDAMAVTTWDFANDVQGWTALTGTAAWNAGALVLTPDGTSASTEARSPSTDGPTPGTTWQATARVSVPVARTVSITIIWRTSANALISVTSTSVAVAAGTVTTLTVSGVAPATAAKAMVSVGEGSTPPSSHVLTVLDAELRGLQTVQVTSTADSGAWTTSTADFPVDLWVGGEQVTASAISGTGLTQTVTVSARGVSGVSRAWPAGTPVDVRQPATSPL